MTFRRRNSPISAPSRCVRRAWSVPRWAPPRCRPTVDGGRSRSKPERSAASSSIDTQAGTSRVILERDTIGHPQFCPDDDNLILYAGPLTDRVWTVRRDGTDNRRVYVREDRMQWVTHEVWLPNRRAIAFVDWPRGMRLIDLESGDTTWLSRFPAWHAAPDSAGRRFVCDTNFPDRGIHVIPLDGDAAGAVTAPARRPRKERTGAARSRTTRARLPSKRASTPIHIRAFRRTALERSSLPTAPATPRFTKSN